MKKSLKLMTLGILFYASSVSAQATHPDLIAQAKKEGRVAWYTTVAIPEAKQLIDMFEKQFPFIKVDLLRSGSGALVNRVISEYAAKNYSADILQGTATRGGFTLLRQKNILGRYDSPEYKFLPADLKDKNGYWGSTFQNTFVLAYNTRNVKPGDVPRTYDDLLKPLWKGRQIINDTENFEWFDGLLNFWGRDKGLAYFRRLAQQEQMFQRGARGRVQLVAAGEAPLTIGYGPHAQSFVIQGAPIEWVPLEPVIVIINTVSITSRPAASRGGKVVYRFSIFQSGATQAPRDEPDSFTQRRRTRPAQANQRIQEGRSGYRERAHQRVDQVISTDLRFDDGLGFEPGSKTFK